jgi:multidrug efflux pump subunit AcrA (membrane-fusion protein)
MSCIRLALLGMALAACRGAAAQPPPAQVPPIAVRTAVALDDYLSDEVELPGTLQAERRAALSVLAPGRVESVTVQRGDAVRAGDVLLRLREVDPRRQVLAAAAALEALRVRAPRDPERAPEVVAARTAWDQAEDAFARTEQLRAAGSVSTQELVRVRLGRDAARAQWSSAVASARAAQASARQAEVAVAQSRQGLQDAVLRAPFDGVVAARDVEPGEWVSPERPVLQIVDATTLRVRVEVPQNLAAQPIEGLRVWFDPEGAVQREASLRWRAPALDPATRTRAVEASLDAPEGALPGQRVLVRWRVGATRRAARVPVDVLRGDGPTATVFAVRDGRAEARVVHVPHRREGWAVVADGLAPGSVVVREPPAALRDGSAVRP